MYLKKIKLKNFRCYEDFEIDNINKLAILIGENDAGKTVLLKAIEWLLSDKPCENGDCREDETGKNGSETSVEGWFEMDKDFDTLDAKYLESKDSDIFHLKKIHTPEDTRIYYFGLGYSDEFNDFKGASRQKELLSKFGLKPETTEDKRKEQREDLVKSGKIHRISSESRKIDLKTYRTLLKEHLPHIRFISASNYESANSIIQSKFREVAKNILDPQNADEKIKPHLESLEKIRQIIDGKLKSEIDDIEGTLKKHHQGLKKANVEMEINFENAVGASALKLNLGDGERPLEQFGDGTKRRMWMGLLEWETEIQNEKSSRSVIRLYDEPDVNLHYRAQQQFFENIKELTKDENHTQCFLSTHSFSMVDRAPSESLVLIRIKENGERKTTQLQLLPEDEDYFDFIGNLAKAGLSNSALLYESGFLLVEGESEEKAIPILYEKFYNRTLVQDGIKLINMLSCTSWKSILKTLLDTRKDAVCFLLDKDCQKENLDNGQTKKPLFNSKSLTEADIDENFVMKQITFIGENEFEDAFSNDILISTLENNYPEVNKEKWQQLDLTNLRQKGKFSDNFLKEAGKIVREFRNVKTSKPKFAKQLAIQCSKEQIPRDIIDAFEKIRRCIGITKNG